MDLKPPNKTLLKQLTNSSHPKTRLDSPHLMAEGEKIFLETLTSKIKPLFYLFTREFWESLSEKIKGKLDSELYGVSLPEFKKISRLESPQGVLSVFDKSEFFWDLEKKAPPGKSAWFLAWGIQDPGNLGTIIRLADAFGFEGVLNTFAGVDPLHPRTIRATSGSFLRIKTARFHGIESLKVFENLGYEFFSTYPSGGSSPDKVPFPLKSVFILGSEGAGLSPLKGIQPLTVNHLPRVDSLNVAITAGIISHNYYLENREKLNESGGN